MTASPTATPAPSGVVERLTRRHRVRAAVRSYFDTQGFLEVEPPTLVPAPGMEPHITAMAVRVDNGEGTRRMWLHTSPEYALKKLLAQGAPRMYALCRVFRAGESGPHHRPEFTMLEWYRAHADFTALLTDCEGFISAAAQALNGEMQVDGLNLAPPFERLTVAQAFAQHAGVDLMPYIAGPDGPGLQLAARAAGIHVVDQGASEHPVDAFERAFYEVMLARVEPAIGRNKPTFLTHWPAPLAALSRLCPDNPLLAERVELYAAGLELGNGFGELTDAPEQLRRLRSEQARRRAMGRPVYPVDRTFIDAVGRMPPAAGMAVGLDRVLMLLCGADNLDDVLTAP